ncbi:Ubiquitin carboxyl-terminal hydrolase 16 [Globomyces sp. JEL0801]|nr:Ubiquitin carboxyl-terminal hydrolase 16 [Globomyces sp. JEL0801]
MYSFDVADSTLTTPTNESWPSFYSFGIMENNQNICGSAPLTLEKSCCISSLDLELSASYSSGVMIDTPTTLSDPVDKFSARGDYCALQAKQSIDLWGYNAIFILANGNCINDTFRCANNGELSIYSSGKNCQGGVKGLSVSTHLVKYGKDVEFWDPASPPLTLSLLRLIRNMNNSSHNSPSTVFNPKELLDRLSKEWPIYARYRQQDAHELLRRLLDSVKEEIIKQRKTIRIEATKQIDQVNVAKIMKGIKYSLIETTAEKSDIQKDTDTESNSNQPQNDSDKPVEQIKNKQEFQSSLLRLAENLDVSFDNDDGTDVGSCVVQSYSQDMGVKRTASSTNDKLLVAQQNTQTNVVIEERPERKVLIGVDEIEQSSHQRNVSTEENPIENKPTDRVMENLEIKPNNDTTPTENVAVNKHTFVDDVFGGKLVSVIICTLSSSFEEFMDLSLSISKVTKKLSLKNYFGSMMRSRTPSTNSYDSFLSSPKQSPRSSFSEQKVIDSANTPAFLDKLQKLSFGMGQTSKQDISSNNSEEQNKEELKEDEESKRIELLQALLKTLPLEDTWRTGVTLESCLSDFFGVEVLEDQFACDHCYKLKYGVSRDGDSKTDKVDSNKNSSQVSIFVTDDTDSNQKTNTDQLDLTNIERTVSNTSIQISSDTDSIDSTNPITDDPQQNGDASAVNDSKTSLSLLTKIQRKETVTSDSDNESFDSSKAVVQTHGSTTNSILEPIAVANESQSLSSQNKGKVIEKKPPIYSRALKRYLLYNIPESLVIHLKRFAQQRFGSKKVTAHIPFPEFLDLECFISPDLPKDKEKHHRQPKTAVYRINAVVVHSGSLFGGHYTSFVRVLGGDVWAHVSDSVVKPANWEMVSKSQAYLLFYERI